MPSIPMYDQQSRLGTDVPLYPVLDAKGNGVGEGLQVLASGAQNLAQSMDVTSRTQAAAEAGAKLAQIQQNHIERFNAAKTDPNVDLSTFTPTLMKALQDDITKSITETRYGYAKGFIRSQGNEFLLHAFEQSKLYQAHQQVVQRLATQKQTNSSVMTSVELDPSHAQQMIAQQMHVIDALEVDPAERLQLKQELHLGATEAAATGIAKADPLGALTALRSPDNQQWPFSELTVDARQRIEMQARTTYTKLTAANIVNVFATQGQRAGLRALNKLDASGLAPDLLADVRAHANEGISALRTERLNQHADTYARIERDISTGNVTSETRQSFQNLYAVGALSPAEYASIGGQIEATAQRSAADDATARVIGDALARGDLLDPKDKDARQYVESYFASAVRSAGIQSPADPAWRALAINTASRTGIVPESVQSYLRSASMSTDPAQAANAANVLNGMRVQNPQVLEYVDEKTKSFGLQVAQLAQAGTPTKQAVEVVRKSVYETPPQQQQFLREVYKKNVKDPATALQKLLRSDDQVNTSFFHRTPAPPDAMVADFNLLAEKYAMTTNGDIERAQSLAYQDLQTRWGRSEVNGSPQLMRYPPERFGVPAETVRAEIAKAYPGKEGRITLLTDAGTENRGYSSITGKPLPLSWALIETDPTTGAISVLPDRYVLPTQKDIEGMVNQARADAMANARARLEAEKAAAAKTIAEAKAGLGTMRGAAEQDLEAMRQLRRLSH